MGESERFSRLFTARMAKKKRGELYTPPRLEKLTQGELKE
jgi:hypothetical protein